MRNDVTKDVWHVPPEVTMARRFTASKLPGIEIQSTDGTYGIISSPVAPYVL